MQNLCFIQILSSLGSATLELTILGFCIYFVIKTKSRAGILLLISSVMTILIRPLDLLFLNYIFTDHNGSSMYLDASKIYSLLSYILFALGLILLLQKQINLEKKIE